ncbi:MAG TPA: histidine phosphatase family protein [Steroidobacteraceae bacterium]|nr:histidine phosphatase family protein [Steroidobacteraceae bacterium]
MRTELNTLKRRPFLFPLLMPIAMMAIVVVAAVWVFDARATTVIVIARHAEADVAADADPNLTLAGKERAARLARVLAQLQTPRAIDAIFAADTHRAQQTVQPLAEALALPTNVVPPSAWNELAARIRSDHRGEVVFVTGDTKNISSVIEALAGESVTISDADYGRLYVIFAPRLSRTRVLLFSY